MGKKEANIKLLDNIYNKISDEKKNEATLIYNELSFILETLDKLRQEIKDKGATDHFINGKQDFIRENPSLTSYNKLMKTYDMFYKNLINLLDKDKEQLETNKIMDYDDFVLKFMYTDSEKYDVSESIFNNKEYKEAKTEQEQDRIYNNLIEQKYNEYKDDPDTFLFTHDALVD